MRRSIWSKFFIYIFSNEEKLKIVQTLPTYHVFIHFKFKIFFFQRLIIDLYCLLNYGFYAFLKKCFIIRSKLSDWTIQVISSYTILHISHIPFWWSPVVLRWLTYFEFLRCRHSINKRFWMENSFGFLEFIFEQKDEFSRNHAIYDW